MFEWTFWAEFWQHHSLYLMFASSFLSATVLPGSSEIIFLGLATAMQLSAQHYFSSSILLLLVVATIGNTLGGMTTYWIGCWLPSPELSQQSNAKVRWVLEKFKRYGSFALLLSWMPVVGDVFCAVAGWIGLPWGKVFSFMLIGKTLRYVFLCYLVIGYQFL
ncbi:YqaA family protein [Pasteurella bettyae]|uniref:SNARE-like domain protein n=1 Tax=Pasteurella bettyae CCUG 2042 TaxID=1095749 RepID=I3DJM9_9PAST|nr:YqaA family protein [Pasteurella bettyae]EIJ71922.1 SNARE-like domain protein [Pasteurella bettyae CCUG 2042]SUB22446.1 inner membrane protein YqaA [Pasteurella bettyae]